MINSNQFKVSASKGLIISKSESTDVIAAIVADSQTDGLQVGDAVKIVDSANLIPAVAKASSSDTSVYFVGYEATKSNSYKPKDNLTIYGDYTTIVLEAGGAVAAGVKIGLDANGKIIAAASGNSIGQALQKATKSGDLIQVKIKNSVLA